MDTETPIDSSPEWLKKAKKYLKSNLYTLFAPCGVILFFYFLGVTGLISPLENITIDLRFRARASHDKKASDQIRLVAIDEDSLKQFGAWPWKRSTHGNLLKLLAPAEPAVTSFDLLFTEPQSEEEDQKFASGTEAMGRAVTGAFTDSNAPKDSQPEHKETLLPTLPLTNIVGDRTKIKGSHFAHYPIQTIRDKSLIGFVDCDPIGSDLVRRLLPMCVHVRNDIWPTLVTQSLMQYWHLTPDQVLIKLGSYVEFPTAQGPVRVPINEHGEVTVNYRDQGNFIGYGYLQLYKQLLRTYVKGEPWPERFPEVKGRVLLVGQTCSGLTDIGPSPLNPQTPLVLVHLNVLNNIFQQDFLTTTPDWWFLIGWMILGYWSMVALRNSGAISAIAIPLLIINLYVAVAFALFWWKSIQIPVIWPTISFFLIHIGAVILRWLEDLKSKAQIKSVFASYISPGVMDNLLKSPDSIKLGGERKPVTIFFSDIRGFTSFSEGANEVELVRQLNEYFEKMVGAVSRYQGTLHKYIGDAIMAVWGDVVPLDEATDAKNAVRCALANKKALVDLNAYWKADGRMELKIGIGLNHGIVCVGNIGASIRKEFTVIGDAVNLASRLEGVTKQFHTDLCIGESVHHWLEGEFLTRTLGLLTVKGKTKPVRVYEVLDDLKGLEPMNFFSHDWARRYEKGFEAYLARDFQQAVDLFTQCLAERPGDFLCETYLAESTDYLANPPEAGWGGIIKLDSK